MKKFLRHFKNINEDRININLIKHNYEEDLVELILDVFKSLDAIKYVKFLDYKVEYDEDKINFSRYIFSRRKKKKRKDRGVNYMYIKPDRACELTMRFVITAGRESKIISKSILVPTFDKNNYLTLKGNKYFLLYQLLDSSTYVSKNGLTLKSLMPVILMYREKLTILTDSTGKDHEVTSYFMKVFRREISVMLFFFCKMGFIEAIRYFNLDKIVRLVVPDEEIDDIYEYKFSVNKNLSICVSKYFFDKYSYVKSITAIIIECFAPKTLPENLNDTDYWLGQLGSLYSVSKDKRLESGRSTMTFFERLLDLTTKKKLKISEINKTSIYAIIRWMVQNFAELRQKDNMNLNTKRLRLNEYIASMLSIKLGEPIKRVLSMDKNANIKSIERNLFRFPPTIINSILGSSALVKYDDRTSDCDFLSALRYTVKGPNSLGNGKSERNIGVKYRGIDVSYIGNLDINVYSSSSPGLNGSLTPFAHTSGLYFNDSPEPQNMDYELYKDMIKLSNDKGYVTPTIGNDDDPISYFDACYKLQSESVFGYDCREKEAAGMLTVLIDEEEKRMI